MGRNRFGGIPPEHGVELYCEGELSTGTGGPLSCRVSFLGDIPKPSGHSPEEGAQGDPA